MNKNAKPLLRFDARGHKIGVRKLRPISPYQVRFCEIYVETGNASQARKECGLKPCSNANHAAIKLLKTPCVIEHIAKLQAITSTQATLTRQDIVDFLADVIRTPIGKVNKDHKLAQSYNPSTGQVTMASKMDAIDRLNRMCGYYEPIKIKATMESKLLVLFGELTGASKAEAIDIDID